jgi:hypothetical protein
VSVPPVLPSDPPDVADALRTAAQVFRREPLDSVDWIRQAAQLAQDAGLDQRAIDLAVAASDIVSNVKGSGTVRVAREAITQDVDTSAHREPKTKTKS